MEGVLGGPLPAKSASAAVADLIRDAILHGRLLPGERLKEDLIARELQVSRTPVREALAILQTEGLLDAPHNRGAIVRTYSPDDLDEMYELRGIVEGAAAARAAARRTETQLEVLRESCEHFERIASDDLEGLVTENARFHDTILEASASKRITAEVLQLRAIPLSYQSYAWYGESELAISQEFHNRVFAAIEAQDEERAERDMREHLLVSRQTLTAAYAAAESDAVGQRD
jgi:DNA-binding GntR family transcriptional regulator